MLVEAVLAKKNHLIWTISPDISVYKALEMMEEKNIGALPVMQDDKLTGMFSERDYARKIILKGKSSKDTLVKDAMSTSVYCIDKKKTLDECMAVMTLKRVRHLPVMENEKMIGLISIGDVVKNIINEQEHVIENLYQYIRGVYY